MEKKKRNQDFIASERLSQTAATFKSAPSPRTGGGDGAEGSLFHVLPGDTEVKRD